jgi:hypothetical protein
MGLLPLGFPCLERLTTPPDVISGLHHPAGATLYVDGEAFRNVMNTCESVAFRSNRRCVLSTVR